MIKKSSARFQKLWIISTLIAFIFLVGILINRWRKQQSKRPPPMSVPSFGASDDTLIEGLTEDEVAEGKPKFDLEGLKKGEQRRFLRQAIRQNLFTTFNVDLFGIAFIMFMLGSPLGALGTLLILIINLCLNVFQEMYTKKKLEVLVQSVQPSVNVIRESKLKSIELTDIVPGDMLVVGTGDQIQVEGSIVGEGEILVDESLHSQETKQVLKRAGDTLHSDSFCIDGRAVYRSSQAGIDRLVGTYKRGIELLSGEKTPLQRLIEIVLRFLFVLVIVFSALLLLDAYVVQAELVSEEYRDAFSIVFGIAPTSLFFLLIMHYTIGSVRISELGALVYKSQSIESLASVSILCLSKNSLLSGVNISLETIEPPHGNEPLSENLIRHILGDVVHSVPVYSEAGRMLAEAIPGSKRNTTEIAPFLSIYGWYAVTFSDPDMHGTFILGKPDVMEPNLVKPKRYVMTEVEQTLTQAENGISRLIRRYIPNTGKRQSGKNSSQQEIVQEIGDNQLADEPILSDPENKKLSFRQRLVASLERLITPVDETNSGKDTSEEPQELVTLLFAHLPDSVPLYDRFNQPQLPRELIPISYLHISESIRPEAKQTIREFTDAGIEIKILSSDAPERAAQTAQALGLNDQISAVTSGEILDELGERELNLKIKGTSIFGFLSPSQKGAVIKSLRNQNAFVAMLGNNVSDVQAMRQADLRIAMKGGSQAALMVTDIVLLHNSLEALPDVLRMGQRLVNGILDTFKLYLSQVVSQLLMIVSLIVLNLQQFPYHPTHAGVVSLFTITFPNILLTFWSATGMMSKEIMRRRLAHFVIPASIASSVLAWAVYYWFFISTSSVNYAMLAVMYALLFTGWLRVLFLQPPSQIWVGGASLRGDRRVIWLILSVALLFAVVVSIPFFQDALHIIWLSPLVDYLWVILAVIIWAFTLRTVWRSKLFRSFIDKRF
ncbi:HAD family hydrolase [Chloroflexota bacterium]